MKKAAPLSAGIQSFKKKVWAHYRAHGRHTLPWRNTRDPYRILVSEIMLQQTQVARVIPFYKTFLKKFPTVRALARAPLGSVLEVWQGLGYNRRAKLLHEAAQTIVAQYGDKVPREEKALCALPGVGPYTACAVRALAYGAHGVGIETNIRTALLHHFFPHRKKVPDAELLALLAKMPSKHPRDWFLALMDYGASLKAAGVRRNAQSAAYAPQKPFRGSLREVRGKIVRALLGGPQTTSALLQTLHLFLPEQVHTALQALHKEKLIFKKGRVWSIGA